MIYSSDVVLYSVDLVRLRRRRCSCEMTLASVLEATADGHQAIVVAIAERDNGRVMPVVAKVDLATGAHEELAELPDGAY